MVFMCKMINEQQYRESTNCYTNCILWHFFLIFLAYIDNFYVYDVIFWSHKGEGIVS